MRAPAPRSCSESPRVARESSLPRHHAPRSDSCRARRILHSRAHGASGRTPPRREQEHHHHEETNPRTNHAPSTSTSEHDSVLDPMRSARHEPARLNHEPARYHARGLALVPHHHAPPVARYRARVRARARRLAPRASIDPRRARSPHASAREPRAGAPPPRARTRRPWCALLARRPLARASTRAARAALSRAPARSRGARALSRFPA